MIAIINKNIKDLLNQFSPDGWGIISLETCGRAYSIRTSRPLTCGEKKKIEGVAISYIGKPHIWGKSL